MRQEVSIFLQNDSPYNIPFYLFGDEGCMARTGNIGFPYDLTFGFCNYHSGYQGLVIESLSQGVKLLNAKSNIPLIMVLTSALHLKHSFEGMAWSEEREFKTDTEFRPTEFSNMPVLDGTKRIFCAIAPSQKLEITFAIEING